MSKKVIALIIASLQVAALLCGRAATRQQVAESRADKLEGVYEFVSRKGVYTKPDKYTTERAFPEWEGIWQFQRGYFSSLLMKKDREEIQSSQNQNSLGCEAYAGQYSIEEGKYISLKLQFAYTSLEKGRTDYFEFRFEGNNLILTQKVRSHLEGFSEGTVITTLRRIK